MKRQYLKPEGIIKLYAYKDVMAVSDVGDDIGYLPSDWLGTKSGGEVQ